MMDEAKIIELNKMIMESLEGSISHQRREILNRMIIEDQAVARHYIDIISINSALSKPGEVGTILLGQNEQEGLQQDNVLAEVVELEYAAKQNEFAANAREQKKEDARNAVLGKDKKQIGVERGRFSLLSVLRVGGAIAAIVAVGVILTVMDWVVNEKFQAQPLAPVVATLQQDIGAKWFSGDAPSIGDNIRAGELRLQKGLAYLEFGDGAEVVLEGPATVKLTSSNGIVLDSGRITALVPDSAFGFEVRTPNSKIVDLGTEFGVSCGGREGATLVQVFKGKVALLAERYDSKSKKNIFQKEELSEKQAMRVTKNRKVEKIEYDNYGYVRREQFLTRIKADEGSAYHHWLLYRDKIRRDPALVAYYSFEMDKDNPETLFNIAKSTEGELHGKLSSSIGDALPEWVQGRWPEKQAIRFEEGSDRIVTVPPDPALSITGPISIAVWGMFPEQGPEHNSGFVFCSRDHNKMNYHLRISEYDTGLKRYYADKYIDQTTFEPLKEFPKGWCHFVVTHDGQVVRYYLNGRPWNSHRLKFNVDEQFITGLVLGSDKVSDAKKSTGILDEITIFNRVLNEDEIKIMHEKGAP